MQRHTIGKAVPPFCNHILLLLHRRSISIVAVLSDAHSVTGDLLLVAIIAGAS
jgi:hypothetical protein